METKTTKTSDGAVSIPVAASRLLYRLRKMQARDVAIICKLDKAVKKAKENTHSSRAIQYLNDVFKETTTLLEQQTTRLMDTVFQETKSPSTTKQQSAISKTPFGTVCFMRFDEGKGKQRKLTIAYTVEYESKEKQTVVATVRYAAVMFTASEDSKPFCYREQRQAAYERFISDGLVKQVELPPGKTFIPGRHLQSMLRREIAEHGVCGKSCEKIRTSRIEELKEMQRKIEAFPRRAIPTPRAPTPTTSSSAPISPPLPPPSTSVADTVS